MTAAVRALVLAGAFAAAWTPASALELAGRIVRRSGTCELEAGRFIVLARTGHSVFTVTPDARGAFRFTDLPEGEVTEIAWDQVAAGPCALWPLWHAYGGAAEGYRFELRTLGDLQSLARRAVVRSAGGGDLQRAARIVERMLDVYAALDEELRTEHGVDRYERVLLAEAVHAAARWREARRASRVPAAAIATERDWHRRRLALEAQRAGEDGAGIPAALAAAADWNRFARQVYRPGGRRWPPLSLAEARERGVGLLRDDGGGRYEAWLLEDVALVKALLASPAVDALVRTRAALVDGLRERALIERRAAVLAPAPEQIRLDRLAALIDALRELARAGGAADQGPYKPAEQAR